MKKLLTAVVSSILFATIFSLVSYVPSSEREPNVYYFGFFETFAFVIIYAGPVYLLVGIPLSIIIDKLTERTNRNSKLLRYFVQLGLYSLAGILVGIIYSLIFYTNISHAEVISFSVYGFFASNFYFHLLFWITKLKGKKG
ncbi:hypothetical protein ABID56_002546 [Alkalibacillus flavidus]|uniref:Uncharacterized protein n=1 Tax=Alkalibacillus flavidus TaxID=546021 RepID=A0ABV2KXU8_9BACI